MRTDPDALTCDIAQTYGITDLQALPIDTLATLAMGLGMDSRVKMAASGMPVPVETILLACIADRLSILIWQNSRDGAKGRNRPSSITESILKTQKDGVAGFDSIEAFEAALHQFDEE